jgi:hypothetical protein
MVVLVVALEIMQTLQAQLRAVLVILLVHLRLKGIMVDQVELEFRLTKAALAVVAALVLLVEMVEAMVEMAEMEQPHQSLAHP